MKTKKQPIHVPSRVVQKLNTLDQRTVLECLSFVQRRQSRDAVLQRLLLDRITRATSTDELLTVQDVAQRLKLSKPRVYELVRMGRLPKLDLGIQIRIPASALAVPLPKHRVYEIA
jgi:excisionase family DNA binding protein